jgi:hypothetical protein
MAYLKRIIREAVLTALDVHRQELQRLDEQRADLIDKIDALQREIALLDSEQLIVIGGE